MGAGTSLKLLLITKRHFMTKDIVREAYGRQYELAVRLADAGWEVKSYCLDYRSIWNKETIHSGGVEWHSYSAPTGLYSWNRDIARETRSWKPCVVLGCADPIHIVAAHKVSVKNKVPFVIDLHDNLESFRSIDFPGLRVNLEKAIRDAAVVFCVSEPLKRMVDDRYASRGTVQVLENAIPETFTKEVRSKSLSRRKFGLDDKDEIVGVAGALYKKRGIEVVLSGFEELRRIDDRMLLALAGPVDKGRHGFGEGVRYFGNLDYGSMPSFLSTFDVGIVPNIRPIFADFCYPQKAVELCALSVPIVAADLGVMKDMAGSRKEILYDPHDASDFVRALRYQLAHKVVLDVTVPTWGQQVEKVNQSLLALLEEGERHVNSHAIRLQERLMRGDGP